MAKSTNKTQETTASVAEFVAQQTDDARRKTCEKLIHIFSKASKFEPKMWGPSIIGFGSYHYKYESGREGDAPLSGFAPRKNDFSLYLSANFPDRELLLSKLGPHKSAKACVYIKNDHDINEEVLAEMVKRSVAHVQEMYP
ncbi:MAG: hypothetical protein CFE24_04600 [Flavobacterium sp. BFFFF2]|nr:MAG: hypothetical protein CFE24_04600 [Flavobacterium sp. BFFFF2]